MSDIEKAAKARLEDLQVEEVSIVDRAANKHRFLVVKRDGSFSLAEIVEQAITPLQLAVSQVNEEGGVIALVSQLRKAADEIEAATKDKDDEPAESETEDEGGETEATPAEPAAEAPAEQPASEPEDDEDEGEGEPAQKAEAPAEPPASEPAPEPPAASEPATEPAQKADKPEHGEWVIDGVVGFDDDGTAYSDAEIEKQDRAEVDVLVSAARSEVAATRAESAATAAETAAETAAQVAKTEKAPMPEENSNKELQGLKTAIDTMIANQTKLVEAVGGITRRIETLEKSYDLPQSRQVEIATNNNPIAESVAWPFDLNAGK